MAKPCPLSDGIYWRSDERDAIPETCLEQCKAVWEEAAVEIPNRVDTIFDDCNHPVEHSDESLQRLEGDQRLYGILHMCMRGCGEAFAEEWTFTCKESAGKPVVNNNPGE